MSNSITEFSLEQSELGKKAEYDSHYNPDKLFPISRKLKRDEINVPDDLPFFGFDMWNHYEVSWLNEKGKPMVALAEIIYSCDSPNIIESKSMKLYFNSLNNSKFKNLETVQNIVEKDLSSNVGALVTVKIIPVSELNKQQNFYKFEDAICIDDLDIECSSYIVDRSSLKVENEEAEEILYSDLLKSNCLITNQPDWASLQVSYKGKKINREGLLRYIISFRNHNEFHEQCIERIFMDIMQYCQPEELTVYGRYTRRGGLDINPYRSTKKTNQVQNIRLPRQ